MPIAITDYLLDHDGVDWSNALATWSWLLPREFTLWLVTRFADLFVVMADGTVHWLDVTGGTLTKVAEDRRDFAEKIDQGDNADDWLMIPLIDRMVAAGMRLSPGQCYGFKLPPVIGGEFSEANCAPIAIEDYLGACGSIHEQLRDAPDGTEVRLEIVNRPDDDSNRSDQATPA
jgi:hypothetical protein